MAREIAEAVTGLRDWRVQHPTATFAELEAAVDERFNAARARVLGELARLSAAADLAGRPAGERARCPACGDRLAPQGKRRRAVVTQGAREVVLERDYARCPACGRGVFPLDEELGLLPGPLSPRLREAVVRVGTWIPSFQRGAAALAYFTGVRVDAETVRRQTEAAGAALVDRETAEAARLEREAPAPAGGPRVQQISADGAMVPLRGGEWAEAKTLAVGEVVAARDGAGAPVVRTVGASYFSRLADSDAFGRLALPELHRRGTATAGTVAAVLDGSLWLQAFVDLHRPDAVRILDFPHAVESLSAAVQAALGVGAVAAVVWLARHAHELKTGDPDAVLAALAALPVHDAADPAAAATARDQALGYLRARREQIAYARFQAMGLPIGSGMVESANKLVVEERLKGPGMHWARPNVDPMLALRCAAANDRWDEVWPGVVRSLRRAPDPCPTRARRPAGLSAAQAGRPRRAPRPPPLRVAPMPADRPRRIVAGRPTPDHPLKRRPFQHRELLRQTTSTKR